MPLDGFYWKQITKKRAKNMALYEKLAVETFGEKVSDEQMASFPDDQLLPFMLLLEKQLTFEQSVYDSNKLAIAIQKSRSGAGFAAMTSYHCAFCHQEEVWGNTNTPDICTECSLKMARNMIQQGMDVKK